MDLGCFFFDEWTFDDSGSLAASKDFAAGYVEGRILFVAAGEAVETFFRQGVDDAADSGPVDGSGAHGAGFGAGVEGGGGELGRGELAADEGAGEAFGVLGGIAFGWDGVVAGGDEDLAGSVDDERAEGMRAVSSCRTSQFDCLVQEGQILKCHFVFTCFPTTVSEI